MVLDVFTDRPFAGNPLAVVLDGESLTGEQMQQIAREFNLSETAFPLRPSEAEVASAAPTTVLRIFTPEVELPFAGHPIGGNRVVAGANRSRSTPASSISSAAPDFLPVEVSQSTTPR